MAHLHFTAAEEFRQRVIQLGEAPEHVVRVGALGLDQLEQGPVVPREKLEKILGLPLEAPGSGVHVSSGDLERNAA